jgi:putative peptide zinc metalloprotease protein
VEQVIQNAQKVALPAFLRKGLEAFRVSKNGKNKYLLRANWNDKIYKFEPWQFFILEVLPGCDDYEKLASVFEDRFGHRITKDEVQGLFSTVADRKLFGLAAISHPILASFEKNRKTPISGEELQAESSTLEADPNHIRAGGAPFETQDRPTPEIHTDAHHQDGLNSDDQANQGALPASGSKTLNLFDGLDSMEGKAQGFLARAVRKNQFTDLPDEKSAGEIAQKAPSEPFFQKQAGDANRIEEPASAESDSDPAAAKATESKTHIESKPAVSAVKTTDKSLPAGVSDAVEFDDILHKQGWKLFNPSWLIKLLHPMLMPLRHTIYLLPLILIAAIFICGHYFFDIEVDFKRFFSDASFVQHALISMVTVNLAVTLVTALAAHTYRASVTGFCIVFYLLFFPRFMARISNVQQLARRERIWLHAAPLMLRLSFFSIGILVWYGAKSLHPALADFGLIIAFAGAISFLLTVNPLVKSSGYHLLSAFLNEPYLRRKQYQALLNKLHGNVYSKADSNLLAAFALTSILYLLLIAAAMLYVFDRFLEIEFGGAAILVIVLIAVALLWRMIIKFRKINRDYDRSAQFERWRKQVLPKAEYDLSEKKPRNAFAVYVKRTVFLLLIAALFLPYNYEPGGNFIILPTKQQAITAGVPGIIEKINFDGGEILKKGTIIGQLSYSDYEAQVNILDAKIDQQQAAIDDLKSKPKPEEVRLAKSALKTQETRAEFSKGKAERLKELYDEGVVSFEDYDDARRTFEVDLDEVKEKRASLELVKSGATPEELAEAEAKLKSYQEERKLYQEKIEQSVFYMPFDGKLTTLHLKQKTGSYLHKGDPLAVAEQASEIKVEIEVPESEIGYVAEGALTRCRFQVYPDEVFNGVVNAIDANVTEKSHAKVIKVLILLENKDGRLKSGMTGYAKIGSEKMPLWKVLSLSIIRFVKVEVWSWLP